VLFHIAFTFRKVLCVNASNEYWNQRVLKSKGKVNKSKKSKLVKKTKKSEKVKKLSKPIYEGGSLSSTAGNGEENDSFSVSSSSNKVFTNKQELVSAVKVYCNDGYGQIEDWDVSRITDMSELFNHLQFCNADISRWDVSGVTNFRAMFFGSNSFNANIGSWDVSSGTDFTWIFEGTTSFDQDIRSWNVSKSLNFYKMFQGAKKFDQDLRMWDVSSAKYFDYMFADAENFDQDLCPWNIRNDASTWMFCRYAECGEPGTCIAEGPQYVVGTLKTNICPPGYQQVSESECYTAALQVTPPDGGTWRQKWLFEGRTKAVSGHPSGCIINKWRGLWNYFYNSGTLVNLYPKSMAHPLCKRA